MRDWLLLLRHTELRVLGPGYAKAHLYTQSTLSVEECSFTIQQPQVDVEDCHWVRTRLCLVRTAFTSARAWQSAPGLTTTTIR